MEVTEAIRVGLGVTMLTVASVSDLRTRRVPNHYWSPFVAFAIVFALHDVLARDVPLQVLLWTYGLALGLCLLWYGLWWIHAFGGADAKGLMVLALLLPWPLDPAAPVPPSLDAVSNGAAVVLLLPLAFLGWNLGRGHRTLPAALLGVRLPLDTARRSQVWPMQRVEEGRLRWHYWQRLGGDREEAYRDLRRAGLQETWATPKIPFMVPLLVGLLLAFWQGNLLLGVLLRP